MVVGIIPDGNRRWAKAHDISVDDGHKIGIENLEDMIDHLLPTLNHIYVYLLAWHNWERNYDELMGLFKIYIPFVHKYINNPKVTIQLGHPSRKIGPKMDLIIRSGGDHRLSGFFPEESNGAKIVIIDKYFPDITINDIKNEITKLDQ